MPRTKNVNGVSIPFTPEEETARDVEEATWAAEAPTRALHRLRLSRNRIISESDWLASSDLTMSEEQKTYRQALRDIPSGLSTEAEIEAAQKDMEENINPVKPS